jgi:hypothetical protein
MVPFAVIVTFSPAVNSPHSNAAGISMGVP